MIECSICKAHNEDKSLYCVECGQRLIPKVPNSGTTANILPSSNPNLQPINLTNSGRLHSPILDLGAEGSGRRAQDKFGVAKDMPTNSGRPNNISRNGLHSPLLDGKNRFINPHPYSESDNDDEESTNIQANTNPPNHTETARLHSPVLDGPISASFNTTYIEDSFSEKEEYESLRSPILKTKVPLPEKNQINENSTGQESRLQSVLGAATGTSGKLTPHANNIAGEDKFIAPLSITGINKLSKANAAYQSAPKRGRSSGSQSLLPTEEEIAPGSDTGSSKGKSALNKTLLTSLIFLALGFKIWYLVSLGSAAFGSAPFAFDQSGQIIVLLLMLVLVLS